MNKNCDSKDIALKTFFLGPMAENEGFVMSLMGEILSRWMSWRRRLYPQDGSAISASDQIDPEFLRKKLKFHQHTLELIERYESEIPTHSPRYMGHMFSEISLPAFMGHWTALLHNPNNVASEASRVGIQIEKEAIEDLLVMVGFNAKDSVGHFTSGGSVANFEAMFRAREWLSKLFPGEKGVVLIPRNRHYSWLKACKLMGIDPEALWQIELDEQGKLDPQDLKKKLELIRVSGRKVMMVVSVMGTTELGSFDPVHEVNEILTHHFKVEPRPWHHVDAAYGGFFCSIQPRPEEIEFAELKKLFDSLRYVESITLDPHKLA